MKKMPLWLALTALFVGQAALDPNGLLAQSTGNEPTEIEVVNEPIASAR
jgi:hypothetical protein